MILVIMICTRTRSRQLRHFAIIFERKIFDFAITLLFSSFLIYCLSLHAVYGHAFSFQSLQEFLVADMLPFTMKLAALFRFDDFRFRQYFSYTIAILSRPIFHLVKITCAPLRLLPAEISLRCRAIPPPATPEILSQAFIWVNARQSI